MKRAVLAAALALVLVVPAHAEYGFDEGSPSPGVFVSAFWWVKHFVIDHEIGLPGGIVVKYHVRRVGLGVRVDTTREVRP